MKRGWFNNKGVATTDCSSRIAVRGERSGYKADSGSGSQADTDFTVIPIGRDTKPIVNEGISIGVAVGQ